MERYNLIWSMCENIGEIERHFNGLQAGYRKLAAGWVLALFIVIGFVVFSQRGKLNENFDCLLPFVSALGVVAFIGILIIWIIDLGVYHRLLLGVFYAGKRLEEDNKWLPAIHHNMSALGPNVMRNIMSFYVFAASLALGACRI